MPTAPLRVLIVDSSEETRTLLCELLDRTGLVCTPCETAPEALVSMRSRTHAAIVIDADTTSTVEWTRLVTAGAGTGSAIVVVGTNRPQSSGTDGVSFMRKPYHYRDLVHRIWGALDAMGSQARSAA